MTKVKVPGDPNNRVAVITSEPRPSAGSRLGRVRIDWDEPVTGQARWAYWDLEDLEEATP